MVFASSVFLNVFLPALLLLYFLCPRPARNALLLAAGLLFYAWGEQGFVLVILAAVGANYVLALLVERTQGSGRRWAVAAAVVFNVGLLVAFKYANFVADNYNALAAACGWPAWHLSPVHLPIGISFFTFEALSYVIDVARKQVPAQRNLSRFALYMTLFPHLIAGPVVRYADLADRLGRRRVTLAGFAEGVWRFVVGLGKKTLLANPLAAVADAVFARPPAELGASAAWLGVACYTLQIFFDFSGYSDMAIGLGKMFSFDFLENFDRPYLAKSVTEFWRRWHISLSTWFRDYLYIPLGGNRGGRLRTCRNLLIVFALCGFWHGASWAFLVWGLFHGLFLTVERLGLGTALGKVPAPIRHGYTLLVVMVGWVFFRAPTLDHAAGYLASMIGLGAGPYQLADWWNRETALVLAAAVVCCLPLADWWARLRERIGAEGWLAAAGGELARVAAAAALLAGSAVQLAAGSYNPFIYFRF